MITLMLQLLLSLDLIPHWKIDCWFLHNRLGESSSCGFLVPRSSGDDRIYSKESD